MLTSIRLRNFKAFDRFDLPLKAPLSIVIGPNNAGKSTAMSAIRSGAAILAVASRRRPERRESLSGGALVSAWGFAPGQILIEEENLRHNFRDDRETSFELTFQSGAKIGAVWPADEDKRQPFFYVRVPRAQYPLTIGAVRAYFGGAIGAVPVLRPLDQRERLLDTKYVRANLGGRLASSHFRNQLFLLYQEHKLDPYLSFVSTWLPELQLRPPSLSQGELDVFYHEGRTNREVVWAGDGIPIFLQILLHIFRLKDTDTIILDEPEVFLHADLQRRLLSVLEGLEAQIVIATHSSEIIASAPQESLIWIDRSRRIAVVGPDPEELGELSKAMGSRFNLRLARLLQTRAALFVEGGDLEILEPIARTLGLTSFDVQASLSVVPLEGSSNWGKLATFDWIADKFLQGAVKAMAIFDRDCASDDAISERESALELAGVDCHIWRRHEIENYLLVPSAIARLSGADSEWVRDQLNLLASEMRDELVALTVAAYTQEGRTRGRDPSEYVREATRDVDCIWTNPEQRLYRVPGKELLRSLNRILVDNGHRTISPRKLAASLTPAEIPSEIDEVLRAIDEVAIG